MATISNTPRPGYVWDATDNVWYPIGVGAHQHTNAADTPAVMPYSTYAAAGKNKILNGDFSINQRNFSSGTTNAEFNLDRWRTVYSGGTSTTSVQTFTPGAAPVSGYEGKNFYRVSVSGQSSSSDSARFQQNMESVRTLAGETATVSFWAKASTGTPKIAVGFGQYFGAVGSPSSFVEILAGTVTISTSWARYSVTVAIPSISGKTLGTDNTDSISLRLFLSGGSSVAYAQGIGLQNADFDIWGVQVESGSNMTAFQTATGNIPSELAACQRFYFRANIDTTSYRLLGQGTVTSVNNCDIAVNLPVQMRIIPYLLETSAMSTFYYEPAGGSTPTSISLSSAATQNIGRVSVAKTSSFTVGYAIGLFSNNTPAYLGFSAEL
jgi:hypothetical protein